jgi:hypothetical protein
MSKAAEQKRLRAEAMESLRAEMAAVDRRDTRKRLADFASAIGTTPEAVKGTDLIFAFEMGECAEILQAALVMMDGSAPQISRKFRAFLAEAVAEYDPREADYVAEFVRDVLSDPLFPAAGLAS